MFWVTLSPIQIPKIRFLFTDNFEKITNHPNLLWLLLPKGDSLGAKKTIEKEEFPQDRDL